MSVQGNGVKLLKYAIKLMRLDGFTDNDIKETMEWSKNVVKKSIIPKDIKATVLSIFDKVIKDL